MPADRPKFPTDYIPKRAILYCRISDSDTTEGVDDQERRLREFASTVLRWGVFTVLIENDTSAFKRRKVTLPDGSNEMRVVRPEFRKALDWLKAGTADGFVALDLDRALRDPRDLEDLIDIVERYRIPVRSITGSLRLDNDADITMARVMTAIANKSSRDTARRVAAKRETMAREGKWAGGPRSFGWNADGVTLRPSETKWIATWAYAFLRDPDTTLSELAREANDAGIPTVTGAQWRVNTLTSILRRPAIAGRMVYQGEDVGKAPWEPIIPVEVWTAIVEKLNDEDRKTTTGPTPKYLGSGEYLCGRCADGTPMKIIHKAKNKMRRGSDPRSYRCRDHAHLSRSQIKLDEYIEEVILARLMRDDARSLLKPASPDVDVDQLRAQAAALRENLAGMARDRALGELSRSEHLEGSRVVKARLAALDEEIQSSVVESPLLPFIEAEDVIAEWDAAPLSVRRTVLRALMTVTVHPSKGLPRGDSFFNRSAIEIRWVGRDGSE